MAQANQPSEAGKGEALSVEAQLAQYARDLQELFLQHRGLKKTAEEKDQQVSKRSQEVSALNEFVRQRLAEMFELETQYEALLDRLDRIAELAEPPYVSSTLKEWVAQGRERLDRMRHGI